MNTKTKNSKTTELHFEIKISGSGTLEEIEKSLNSIMETFQGNPIHGWEYEDSTLMAEISPCEPFNED